ncbi:methylated-DNA--[protein]-cysteine S-methyltransferase [Pseudothermotoga sp.]|nr:methylated-DNA--[protein]-cysteine S-methyltransferase [Pseudothermotoga sp.]MCX7813564.1 methylated-DNA--[protein]-cysteine S-methyltransferase [Pseudothermotoga sp.]MDW8140032.1 methylated-DNA--[protein]-cysteine S-methyltransferase [Pseudothermotoga sp.]
MERFVFESPFGPICVHVQSGQVLQIDLGKKCEVSTQPEPEIVRQLEEYFSRKRTQLDFPVRVVGTEFQLRVWHALRDIPYGSTLSYGELAKRLHTSARAVGQALKKNPLAIYFPCHRVVAKGSLGGFSSGLEWKQRLLALERGERCAQS